MLCSVRWTSENVPVCLHDETINRAARNDDGTALSDTVRIADITLEQANAYDWGLVSGESFRGLKMPTLESVVRFAKFMNCEIYVEIKGLPTDAQLESMYNIIDSYNIEKSLTFSASYISILEKVTVRYPSARLGYGVAPSVITQETIASMQALKTNVNEVFFHVYKDNEASGIITSEMLSLLKGSNVGFELTEIQNESTFNSFIEDSNNSYVTRVAIRYKPVEYYLRDYFLGG
jgi:glycerophosphoryl diester phosphodiesterase